MFQSNKKILASVFAATLMIGGLSSAQAATTMIMPSPGTYTFSGTGVNLGVGSLINVSCKLSLTGDASVNDDGSVTIAVNDGSVSGPGLCGSVGLNFDKPWTIDVPQAELPTTQMPTTAVKGMFQNVVVTYLGQTCNGGPSSIPVTFRNGSPTSDPSTFSFDSNIGECSVDGVIDAESDVNVQVSN